MAEINEAEVMDALRECYDPEIPVNIVDLGLVYGVDINNEEGNVHVTMTLTAMGCPMAGEVMSEVEMRVGEVEHVKSCKVDLTFDPPWSPDRMTEDAKWELGMISGRRRLNHAQFPFGIFGHAIGRPGGIKGKINLARFDVLDLAHAHLDLFHDLVCQRATQRGQRHSHMHVARLVIGLDAIDQAEVDDIDRDFRVIAFAQGIHHFRFINFCHPVAPLSVCCLNYSLILVKW